jgi:DNA-binding transcriptional LysR family regulator
MDLNRVKIFASVVERAGFTSAARSLGISKSAVSRALQDLESDIGVRLLQRTTRKLSLTSAGRAYFDRIRGALGHLEEANGIVSGMNREPAGLVRLAAPDLGGMLLPRIVGEFVARYPRIRIELSLSARLVDLVEEGFDLAVRSGRLGSSSLIARRVATQVSGLCASDRYLRRRGCPESLSEVAEHDCILIRRPHASEGSGGVWNLRSGLRRESVKISGPLIVDDLVAACEAIRLGLGIGFIPRFPGLTDGLVRVLPQYASPPIPVSVVWPSRRLEPTRVVLFRDFLMAGLRRERWDR